ncbi:acyl-CoA N-acyltransferase [Bisporella sp. PMI_857]|nr:acyl-CoA N-acyltransferase [Bisporella sp. PMI_857]
MVTQDEAELQEPKADIISASEFATRSFTISITKSLTDINAIEALKTAYCNSNIPMLPTHDLESLPSPYGPPSGCLLLAYSASTPPIPLGMIAYRWRPEISLTCCEMNRLYVSPKARGMGLRKVLVKELCGYAKKSGYGEMRLGVFTANEPAVRLYEGIGWRKIERYKEKLYDGIQAYS